MSNQFSPEEDRNATVSNLWQRFKDSRQGQFSGRYTITRMWITDGPWSDLQNGFTEALEQFRVELEGLGWSVEPTEVEHFRWNLFARLRGKTIAHSYFVIKPQAAS